LIAIVGPTASGKTALSIKLAQALNTEIISADSRQFYKEMSIGTAVPDKAELQAAKHHFIQHKSIFDDYNVGQFEKDFINLSSDLFQNHKHLILVGGSGLYIKAACEGLDDLPGKNEAIRHKLESELDKNGIGRLQEKLQKLDSDYYKTVDIQNPHRLIRAIEILEQSNGQKMSELLKNKPKRPFETIYIGLNSDRNYLYDRINQRVDIMMANGLLDEAKKLYPHKSLNALQTVGYRELFEYFDGQISLDFAISEIKKNTRRFAKRQLTWFRKNPDIKWFDINDDFDKIYEYVKNKIAQ
jgi:tRNA dimethylallyltransferase